MHFFCHYAINSRITAKTSGWGINLSTDTPTNKKPKNCISQCHCFQPSPASDFFSLTFTEDFLDTFVFSFPDSFDDSFSLVDSLSFVGSFDSFVDSLLDSFEDSFDDPLDSFSLPESFSFFSLDDSLDESVKKMKQTLFVKIHRI